MFGIPISMIFYGAIAAAGAAALAYLMYLRKRNASLSEQLTLAKHANDTNIKTILELNKMNEQYRLQFETAVKVDTKTEKEKTEAIKAADKLTGSDGDTITQEDIDRLNAAKTNRSKK